MRPSLSLKTLLRTPFKTIMTFLLIALASFSLFARIADYSVTAREMKKVESTYHGVIAIDNGVPLIGELKQQYSNLPKTTSWVPSVRADKTPFVSPATPKPLTYEQMNVFSNLSGVTAQNRYMTGGVIENFERLNSEVSPEYDWGHDYGARFIIEATFESFSDHAFIIYNQGYVLNFSNLKQVAGRRVYNDGVTMPIIAGTIYGGDRDPDAMDEGEYSYPTRITIGDQIVTGNLPMFGSNSCFIFPNDPYRRDFAESLVPGKRYFIIGRYVPNSFDIENYDAYSKSIITRYIGDYKADITKDLFDELERGKYSVIPLEEIIPFLKEERRKKYAAETESTVPIEKRIEDAIVGLPELLSGNPMMRLGDYETYDYVPSFFEITDTENLAKAQELIDITNQDLHTFDIVYTENMASIPRFNERSMVITSGRAITADDSEICVISEYLASAYGLKLGDKLNIGLGDRLFEQYAQMGAIAYIPERNWSVVKNTELEIVGIYKDIDAMESRNADMFMGYSPNTIFVPMSELPIEIPADHEIKPGEFSVFIENPADFERVLAEAEPIAAEMGVKLRASDGGYANIKDSINESAKTSVITMCLYVFAAALALVLSIYLYIGRNTKSYAIMRAIGTTVKKSRSSLTLPFGLLCTTGILLGGIVGILYTQNEMKTVLKSFEVLGSSYTADASIPVVTVIIALFCEVLFISGFTTLFLHRLAVTSPLTLLQGDSSKKAKLKKVKKTITESAVTYIPFEIRAFVLSPLPEKRNYSAFRQSFGYISRHMMRTKWKTVIALILSFALTVAMGVITMTKSNYEEMFRQVDVKSSINNFNQASILKLAESDLIKELYFFIDRPFVVNGIIMDKAVDVKVTNDIYRYFSDLLKSEPPITYLDGYSNDLFVVDILSDSDNVVCIIGSKVAVDYDIKLGDKITLIDYDIFQSCNVLINNEDYKNLLASQFEGEYETDEELQELVNQDIMNGIAGFTKSYKVVGIAESDSGNIADTIYLPYGKTTELLISGNNPEDTFTRLAPPFAEIILSDNDKLQELNELLDNLLDESMGYYASDRAGASSYYTDTTELDNIRRVRDLLTALFPIAVAAAVLIGAAVPILIIIQSSKEAAIMRVLGTTKKRTVAILALEQIILCILGIVIATGVLLIYNAGLFILSGSTLAVCALIYITASVIAAVIAAAATTNKKALELLQVKE
jgi:ABC-type antimicrobial peptide transport system permease subunit